MTGLVVMTVLPTVILALRWYARRRGRLQRMMGADEDSALALVAVPVGWHLVGIAVADDVGRTQLLGIPDPVAEAERATKGAS